MGRNLYKRYPFLTQSPSHPVTQPPSHPASPASPANLVISASQLAYAWFASQPGPIMLVQSGKSTLQQAIESALPLNVCWKGQ
jgi:hypothetical protein